MVGTKYLSQVMQEVLKGGELGSNTLIVSPVGSGKTHYIFEDLCKHAKTLYLCDTKNLRDSVLEDHGYHVTELQDLDNYDRTSFLNIRVTTYAKFGRLIEKNPTMLEEYDYVICDEAHNILNYERMEGNNQVYMKLASQALCQTYTDIKIVWMTATPYSIKIACKKYSHFTDYFTTYDFVKYADKYDIRRYTENCLGYINHFTDIERKLKQYEQAFKYHNWQCLIYTTHIHTMQDIQNMCENLGLKAICIWSERAEGKPMGIEQKVVRDYLLKEKCLKNPYQVLIINRSMETGINIENWDLEKYPNKPYRMNLMFAQVNEISQQIQARGRIRHDIDLFVINTKDRSKLDFDMDKTLLDKWLTKGTIQEFVITKNNMRNDEGRMLTVNGLTKVITQYGYKIESKKFRDKEQCAKTGKNKRITLYKITKL